MIDAEAGSTLGCTFVAVRMRDGVALATDVYGIREEGTALPVVLERTPYGRRSTRTSDGISLGAPIPLPAETARRFVESGLIVVRQDCRGRGDSEGEFEKYVNEADDGEDTLEWIASQPWCDGRIGMMGVSYSAHAQTAVAARGPASLMTMILDSGGFTSAFESGVRYGGAFELKQATWAMRHARKSADRRSSEQRARLEAVDISDWFARMPTEPWQPGHSPLAAAPEYEAFLFDQWRRDELDDGWRRESVNSRTAGERFAKVPTLMIGSWYDPYVRSTIELYHRQLCRGVEARLVMGPWLHGMRTQTHSGDVEFGAAAAWDEAFGQDYTATRIDWVEAAVSDIPSELSAVTTFVMGGGDGTKDARGRLLHGGRWHRWSAWPPTIARPKTFALSADGSLVGEVGEADSLELIAHPEHPVPTSGGQITSGGQVMAGGGFDQSALDYREDVLSFRSAPLAEALTVAGRVQLRINLIPSTPDLDISAKLIDEYPPSADYPHGYALNLCDGIMRARYRRGYEQKVLLEPGSTAELHVDMPDTANRFERGHRIRLDLAGSSFPRFDVNPNHGGPPWDDRRLTARSTIVLDGSTFLEADVIVDGEELENRQS